MGPTGVVLELSHEDWEKMQNGATLEELKSVKEFGIDGYAERQRMNTGDNEKRDKIQRAKERLAKDVDKSGIKKTIEIEKAALRDAERNQNSRYFGDDDYAEGKRERIRDLQRKLQGGAPVKEMGYGMKPMKKMKPMK